MERQARPAAGTQRADGAGDLSKGIPGRTAGTPNLLITVVTPIRQTAIPQLLPNLFGRIQLWRSWRQQQQRHIGKPWEFFSGMPSCLIQYQQRMVARRNGETDLFEMQGHHVGIGIRQYQPHSSIACWACHCRMDTGSSALYVTLETVSCLCKTRILRSAKLALPYICRFNIFSRLICPSTMPLL